MSKITEAHARANRRWDAKNKERKLYLTQRSTCKNFILKKATKEDLEAIKGYIETRLSLLAENKQKGVQ
ncbi:hypothetical protein [Lactobacillus corticis]|uniref:Uncharacterized protein n=1 Tax=Lactobacillus corticis TaxID=2201249 RepID=A0A916QJK2_9LACO|nr:hypothetical protein [Lactobacillus corticis]GFZ27502.1 hypothetical protein LCB40_13820 [Lactobacillus corticis]